MKRVTGGKENLYLVYSIVIYNISLMNLYHKYSIFCTFPSYLVFLS